MKKSETNSPISHSTLEQASKLFAAHQQTIYKSTDRMFAVLMSVQWIAAIFAALWISPRTWVGTASQTHINVWASIFLGGAISLFPIVLAVVRPGATSTRYVIATAQMMMSALLIHLTGGRIETHFHVFGSLAFLAFYRDWRVLVPATIVVAVDHFLRGVFWPQSVYGVLSASEWRWLEHAGWVLFEDTFLYIAIKRSVSEMWDIAVRTTETRDLNQSLEQRVTERTILLATANDELQKEIAERMVVDAALLDSEARYRQIVNNASDIIYKTRPSGHFIFCNPTAMRIMKRSEEELIGLHYLEVIRPDHRASVEKFYARQFKERIPNTYLELPVVAKDGTEVWIGQNVQLIVKDDWVVENQAIARDVTERKRAEEALRQSETLLRSVIEGTPDAIFVKDLKGRYLLVNSAMASFVGKPVEKILGRDDTELYPPEVARQFIADDRQVAASGETQTFDGRTTSAQVMARDYSVTKAVYRDHEGNVIGVIGISRDVTERKRAEEAQRESEERFASFMRNLPGVATIKDSRGQYIYANEGFESTFRLKPGDWRGKTDHEVWPSGVADYFKEHDQRVLASRDVLQVTETVPHHDGLHYWLVNKFPILDEHQTPVMVGGIAIDITERKQAEETLARKAEELARSNAELEQFAYVASHDLQEPLRMVSSYTQLLGRRFKGKLDADADEFISYAVDGANRMQRLIQDLLEYSRIGAKGKEFELIDCEAVLETSLDNLRMAIEENGAEVTYDPLPTVMADDLQLGQVFQNLIGNANKFCKDRRPRVHVSAEQQETEWLFSVRDNGIGIAAEYAERIFVIFQQLHGKTEYPGTGIGLAICKKIVERHGGRIWMESQLGEGATFYFTLPKAYRGSPRLLYT